MKTAAALVLACAPALSAAAAVQQPAAPVRFAMGTELGGFDPAFANSMGHQVLQRQIYEGLYEYAYGQPGFALQPLLAASSETSDDGLLWVFTLRADARFHDPWDEPLWPGRERAVRAMDVVESWLRQADGGLATEGFWALEDLVVGLDEFRAQTARGADARAEAWSAARAAGGIAGLRALDERVLLVRLIRNEPDFLHRLASSYTVVYPAEAVARSGADFVNEPVGSGAYSLAEWTPGEDATFRRVPGWRGQPDPFGGGPLPHLDAVRFTRVPAGSTRLLMFDRGDIATLNPSVAWDRLVVDGREPAEPWRSRGVKLEMVDTPLVTMLAFQMRDPVVGNVPGDEPGNARRRLLRAAIARALPYGRWLKEVRNSHEGRLATSFLPPELAEAENAPAGPFASEDLAEARRLLAAAGYPDGKGLPALRLDLSGPGEANRRIGLILQDGLARVGIRVEPELNAGGKYFERIREGKVLLFPYIWTLDWPDPANLLAVFAGGAANGTNFTGFSDREYDRLFAAFRALPKGAERSAAAHALLVRLHQELPAIPLDHLRGFKLVQPWLGGYVPSSVDMLPAKYLYRLETSR
ncbi:MAG TPA: ABC transporter substrate-binding protein [Planctomycetota bacterium]